MVHYIKKASHTVCGGETYVHRSDHILLIHSKIIAQIKLIY